ncbi:maleylpyruvate isomerase [Micromonospora sp. Llam0]|uniref:maleylpyruvate isomerase family mycothiol-dependent enzyme n=1 Tax=Micromonospora sp. Llam0 TaxID=2485143 RepID=UPI000FA72FC1|nr:maleylpyruvate isomerase family mycothiol-dependent enzyme [Micromonospora sp. Llam0]ROO52601.1 maleylpyruvate isomerase [Micromonospora sp. Llam0]
MEFEPEVLLNKIEAATEQLLATAASFNDADVREPSLLPGWSRGHVLTHVARNADGGTRMLTRARTGVQTSEYPSMATRAAQIEAGHHRSAKTLLADVHDSAARYAVAYRSMPARAWSRPLRWTSGKVRPAYRAADSRLTEVLVHHVDLRTSFRPESWPDGFVSTTMTTVISAFTTRKDVPALRLVATDAGTEHQLGAQDDALVVRGQQASLLAWLLGRSDGTEFGESLPALPFLY